MAKNTMTAREELLAVETPGDSTNVRIKTAEGQTSFKLEGKSAGFNDDQVAALVARQKDAVKVKTTGQSNLGKNAVSINQEFAGKALLGKLAAFVAKAAKEKADLAAESEEGGKPPVVKPTIAANKPVA